MKSFCILLNGAISNDARVIKTIQSLSKKFKVDLYYVEPSEKDKSIFNENVCLFPVLSPYGSFKKKLRINLFFYKVYNFLADEVLKSEKKYDYVWANDLPTLLPAYIIKKKLGFPTKLIYDSHEIYTETINQFYSKSKNIFKNYIFKILIFVMRFLGKKNETVLIKEVDLFITVGDAVGEYFEKDRKYPKPLIIKNCPKLLTQFTKKNLIRSEFNLLADDIVFLYQGGINDGRYLDLIVDAFAQTDESVKLLILGSGPLKPTLEEKVAKLSLQKKIYFKEAVPYSELFNYTASADFGINYVAALNLSKKLASPNKVFEYIQNNLPILMSDSIENINILKKYKVGLTTPCTIQGILKGINEIQKINNTDFENGFKAAQVEYNWEAEESKLLNAVNQI